jgi:hypothetical protein
MLPKAGDMIYQQAPFQEILDHGEIAELYGDGALFSSGLIVHAHNAFDGNLYNACSALLGNGEKIRFPDISSQDENISLLACDKIYKKYRWIRQAKKFARKYFDSDCEKLVKCLKHVDAWKKWCDLERSYVPVPWEKMTESVDNTKHTQFVACSGSSCEIIRF